MRFSLRNIFSSVDKDKRIHLDYASTTPVHPEVLNAMQPYWNEQWANPSAIYKEGVEARTVIESSRKELARTLRVRREDITFTSGGTESNNLAIIGLVETLHRDGKEYADMEVISTRIEHPSILETLLYIEKKGITIQYAPVDIEGKIILKDFEALLSPKTVLVTFAYVNSEIGVVQDVKKITRAVRIFNETQNTNIRTHLDASQAPLWLSCEQDMLGVDMMTLDAGKCYGPKGIGVLTHRHWLKLSPILFGGGQENSLRSGTENTALIVGCVKALVCAQKDFASRSLATARLRDDGIKLIQKEIPEAILNGSTEFRVANNINISIPGLDTEYAVIWLDAKGIAVSTKSACGTAGSTGSSVVREISHDEVRSTSTLRITLGEETQNTDVAIVVERLGEFVSFMKNSGRV